MLLLFFIISYSQSQLAYNQIELGCLTYIGTTCIELCNLGQQDCSSGVICEYGYFLFDQECVLCPYQTVDDKLTLYCMDCVEHPYTWYTSRTCSYDYTIENGDSNSGTYIKNVREYTELYYIGPALSNGINTDILPRESQQKYQPYICSGCKSFCTPGLDQGCNEISSPYTEDLNILGIICLPTFEFKNEMCISCSSNCLTCKDGECLDCMNGYMIKNSGCISCMNNCLQCYSLVATLQQLCLQCNTGYVASLDQLSCEACGNECSRCEYTSYSTVDYQYPTRYQVRILTPSVVNLYIKRCRQCSTNSFISSNGNDCVACQIRFCDVCYYNIRGQVTTQDIDFEPAKSGDTVSDILCFKCQSGYVLSDDKKSCNTLTPLLHIVQDCDRNYYKGTDIKCLQCLTDYILDQAVSGCYGQCSSYISHCSICYSYKSLDVTNYMDHGVIKERAAQTLFQCITCDSGYYPNLFTGYCDPCPGNCAQCWQYSQTYNFTDFLIKMQPINTSQKEVFLNDIPILVECTSCQDGYQLYGNQCLGCTADCQIENPNLNPAIMGDDLISSCVFKSSYAFCGQCYDPFNDRSLVADQSECITCPSNCIACRDRQSIEITNPYFNPDNSNLLRYGRLCYKILSDQMSNLMKVTYNSILNLPIQCMYKTVSISNTNRCKHTASITVYIYCNQQEYSDKIKTLDPADQVFYYYLNDFYYLDSSDNATIKFSDIQNFDIYSKMNQLPLEILDLNVKFVSTDTHTCSFPKTTIFESDIQRNVFALSDFSMHISSEQPITFYINGMLEFNNYQNIEISHITILPADNTTNFGLNFYGSLPTIVNLHNCNIGYSTYTSGTQFKFLLSNILSLTLKYVRISYLSSNDLITINQSLINNYTIIFNNLIIEHSSFIDTILFPLSPYGDFIIDGFSIIDCTLNNTKLFEDNAEYLEFVASITINNMLIKETYFYKDSAIVCSSNLQNLILSKIDLVGCNFNSSELFISNIIAVSKVYIYGNVFTNESRVFVSADQVADTEIFRTQITISQIVITNTKFTSNTCYNINCLMILETPFNVQDLRTSLFISDLYIYNNYIEVDLIKTQSVSSAIVKITKIKSAILNNIVIDTQLAITVISLQFISSLDINKFLCDWSNPYIGPKDMDPRTKVANQTRILYPFNNKIPASSSCSSEKYKFGSFNSYCLHVQDFLYGVRIQDVALKGLLGIDTGFIYIQSYESIIKQTSEYSDETASKDVFYYYYTNEVIILQNIRIFNTSISAVSPVANLASVVIISDQLQTVIIDGVTAIGNHLHQQVESISTEIAPCLIILSTNGNISISNMEYQSNRATQSSYGINVFKANILEISNSLFNYTNILESNWLDRMDEYQISKYSQLLSYFYIESNGANLQVQSKYLILNSIQMFNTKSMCGSSLYFLGQDTATLIVSNSQFINQSASLEYIDASMGGSFYLDCSKSKLTIQMSYITINNSMARLKGGCIYIDTSIQEQTILIDHGNFFGCQSLSSSFLDVSFSVSAKVLPAIMINNTQIMNNQFGQFLRKTPDLSYEEEMQIVAGTSLFVQNYGILIIQSTKFLNIDIQGLLLLTNIVEVIFQDITIKASKIFIQSLIIIKNYNQYSLISLNNIIISDVSEQNILTQAQFYGTFNSVCEESTTLFLTVNSQVCTEQEDLRSFYQELYNYRQISQTKLDNSTLYEYYDTLTDDAKYNLDSIDLDAKRVISIYQNFVIEMQNNTISMDNYELCSFTYLNEQYTINNETAFIKITPIKNVNFVNLSSITLKDNNCIRCEGGLIQLNNFDSGGKNVDITSMICQQNKIGYFGCLAITTQTKASYILNRRLLTTLSYNVNISKSIFTMNTAKMGTAITIIGLSVNILQSYFSDNTASLIGGALLFVYNSENKNILNQYENSYIQNTAQLGSAIYMMGNTLNDQEQSLLYIYHNEGTQVESIPQKLTIRMKTGQLMNTKVFGTADGDLDDDGKIDGESSQIIDILNISSTSLPTITSNYLLLPSGQAISKYKYYYAETQEQVPYDWIFRIINLDINGKEVNSISSSETCNIAGRLMDSDNLNLKKSFLTNFTSLSVVTFDTITNTFNLDNMQVYFDPYLPNNLYLQLKFTCTSIKIPIYNQKPPYNVTGYDTNYALYVNIKTIPCQVGEAYQNQLCISCDSTNTYSVQENSVQCKGINSIQMEEVLPVRIKLNVQYWRPYPLNDNIEQCYNLVTNCLGGWVAGDASCFEGHVGALCEQCDIYGTRGSPYSISKKYTCGACADTMSTNILIIIAISIFTLVTMIMSVKGNYEFIENLVHQKVLQSIGARTKVSENNASILMKQLTNYLQIIAALTSFRISLPTSFVSSMEVMGNPTQSMAYSLDCFLVSISSIDLLYFRMAWALLMPLFYVFLFFMGYFFGVLIGLAPFKLGVAYTTFIYMFIYLQPTLVGGFMALLSSRTVSGVEWVQGNVSYEYYTDNHQYYLIIFIGPMLLLWSVIFPLIFLQCVRQNKHQLDKMVILKKWGFFYHEYNTNSYLWEFVKIFEKELVIIALTYYENQIVIKGLIVFLIIFIYGAFSFAFIPYKQKKLNFVDQMSTAVCACSLCLGVLIYASQSENLDYLQYTMFLIIGAVNAVLILLILSHLFQGYVDKFDDKLDAVRDKIKLSYPNIDFQFPSLRKFLINKKNMKERVDLLWAALRYETRAGIKRRRKDKSIPLFVSKRRKSTSISQEVSEKDFHKHDSPIMDQQENNAAQSPGSNSDSQAALIKKPPLNGAIHSLIVKQTSDEKHSSESSDSKIYPEIHSGFPSSRQVVEKTQENKTLLKHKL